MESHMPRNWQMGSYLMQMTMFSDSAMSEPDYHYRSKEDVQTPTKQRTPEPRRQSALSVNTYVRKTIKDMPKTMDRISQLRYA